MFCNKCGCEIPVNVSKCPNCGADIPSMEYCSGFWMELNQNSSANDDITDIKEQKSQDQNAGMKSGGSIPDARKHVMHEKAAKPSLLFKYAMIAEAVIIASLLLYHVVSAASLRNELNKTQTMYNSVNEEIGKLNETIQNLKQEISDRDALISDYEERIRKLEEEPVQKEDQNTTVPDEGIGNSGVGGTNSGEGNTNSGEGITIHQIL